MSNYFSKRTGAEVEALLDMVSEQNKLLAQWRELYPSETLLENIGDWVTVDSSATGYEPQAAQIMDADEVTRTCRVRFNFMGQQDVSFVGRFHLTHRDNEMPISQVTQEVGGYCLVAYSFDILVPFQEVEEQPTLLSLFGNYELEVVTP